MPRYRRCPDDTPAHVLAMLAQNPPVRRVLEAGRGERLWSTADQIQASIAKLTSEKHLTREEAMNLTMEELRLLRTPMLDRSDKPKERVPQVKGRGRGAQKEKEKAPVDPLDEVVGSLLERLSTVEMLLDTRAALWAYTTQLKNTTAASMVRETGAGMVAMLWLGLRCFLEVSRRSSPPTPRQGSERERG
jgi:hypothetical protein